MNTFTIPQRDMTEIDRIDSKLLEMIFENKKENVPKLILSLIPRYFADDFLNPLMIAQSLLYFENLVINDDNDSLHIVEVLRLQMIDPYHGILIINKILECYSQMIKGILENPPALRNIEVLLALQGAMQGKNLKHYKKKLKIRSMLFLLFAIPEKIKKYFRQRFLTSSPRP